MKQRHSQPASLQPNGFTLAELLIALAILGVIATFTIPKSLDSGNEGKKNAIVKEMISTIAQAHSNAKLAGALTTATNPGFLIGTYTNYLKTSFMSPPCPGFGGIECYWYHNGSVIQTSEPAPHNFVTSDSTSAIFFTIYPNENDASDSIEVFLYYNGRITTRGNVMANTYAFANTDISPNPALDPPWFSWSN